MITDLTLYITADSAPQALDRALNKLDRMNDVVSIENYTMKLVGENRYQIHFS